MNIRRSLIISLLSLPLAGCQRALDIRVSGTVQALMISLGPVGLAALVGSAPQIDHLHIYEVPRQGSFSDVWEITAPSGCRPLDQPIRYGAPPAGFSQLREPQPLKEQTLYRVQSIGCGYVGFAYFSINDGNVRALTWEEVEGSS